MGEDDDGVRGEASPPSPLSLNLKVHGRTLPSSLHQPSTLLIEHIMDDESMASASGAESDQEQVALRQSKFADTPQEDLNEETEEDEDEDDDDEEEDDDEDEDEDEDDDTGGEHQ